MDIAFTTSDVSLLVTIAASSWLRGADLRRIMFTSDYLDRTYFTPQELRRGMAKLIAAGYVQEKHGRFSLTRAGRRLVSWRKSRGGSIAAAYSVKKRLEIELSATDGPTNNPLFEDSNWPFPEISDEAVARELERYLR